METKQTKDVTGSILEQDQLMAVFCGTMLQHFRMIQILPHLCIKRLSLSCSPS